MREIGEDLGSADPQRGRTKASTEPQRGRAEYSADVSAVANWELLANRADSLGSGRQVQIPTAVRIPDCQAKGGRY